MPSKLKNNSGPKAIVIDSDSDSDFEVLEPIQLEVKKDAGFSKKQQPKQTPQYMPEFVLELAKSGRAKCKKCNSAIAKSDLRVGVYVQGDRWITTNWQHLNCTIFPPTVKVCEAINGFLELSAEMQLFVRDRVAKSANEIDPDDIPIDPNELVRMNWSEELEPVNELLMPLLPYQKEGLGWMVNQEQTAVRGGILADEMGKQCLDLNFTERTLLSDV